jgi:anti-anti-sigma factor
VTVTDRNGGVAVHIDGDLDIVNADSAWGRLEEAIDESEGDVVLDLRNCGFIDSTGLRVVIRAAKLIAERGRGTLGVARAQPRVREVFRLTALGRFRLLELRDDTPPA